MAADRFALLLEDFKHHPKLGEIPAFAVDKLKLDKAILENLDTEKKQEVLDWMKTYLDYDKLSYVGW